MHLSYFNKCYISNWLRKASITCPQKLKNVGLTVYQEAAYSYTVDKGLSFLHQKTDFDI